VRHVADRVVRLTRAGEDSGGDDDQNEPEHA
jgi:hypothetical protein